MIFAVCVVVALVAGELIAGWLGPRLHDAPLFHSTEADLKLEQMRDLDAGVDVVFVGSSVTGVAVEPGIVSDVTGHSSYNASLAAAGPQLLLPWLSDVVLPELRPSVVAIGVTSYDLYDGDAAAFADAFVESRGYRMVTDQESTMDRVDRWFFERLDLWRYRSDLRDPYTVLQALTGGVASDNWAEITADNGHLVPLEVPGGFIDENGPPLGDWSIGTESIEDLRAMIEAVKASGARVVLMNMPLTNNYISSHPHGEQDFRQYEAKLRDFAVEEGVPLLFYDQRDISAFADRVHLNAGGVARFSDRFAHDLERLGVLDAPWDPDSGFGSPSSSEPLTFSG